jgi:hypothetical protein
MDVDDFGWRSAECQAASGERGMWSSEGRAARKTRSVRGRGARKCRLPAPGNECAVDRWSVDGGIDDWRGIDGENYWCADTVDVR